MNRIRMLAVVAVASSLMGTASDADAQSYNVLKECLALSPLLDDIHVCLDNYLDLMDANISDITDFLSNSLSGEALAGLERSQQAFEDYRRQNCLWYLDFSSPRVEAEQIAKNCLATMSQQRLQELQSLVSVEDTTGDALRGFYVYGAERNSFQLCGSDSRYWLEGDNDLVSRAQQQYLSISTSERQVLFAVFAGKIDAEMQAPSGHQGVLQLDALIELRVPTESDCRLPSERAKPASTAHTPVASVSTTGDMPAERQPASEDQPQEQLIAYFGAWIADCSNNDGERACRLRVDLESGAGTPAATLFVDRLKGQATSMEVVFADREIDDPSRIRWQIDSVELGDIVGSGIRVDETGARQLITDSRFLREDLFQKMIDGLQLQLQVLDSVDDASGERYTGTLNGLTKATTFADGFIRNGAS